MCMTTGSDYLLFLSSSACHPYLSFPLCSHSVLNVKCLKAGVEALHVSQQLLTCIDDF